MSNRTLLRWTCLVSSPAVFCFFRRGWLEGGPCSAVVTTTCAVDTDMAAAVSCVTLATTAVAFLMTFLGPSQEVDRAPSSYSFLFVVLFVWLLKERLELNWHIILLWYIRFTWPSMNIININIQEKFAWNEIQLGSPLMLLLLISNETYVPPLPVNKLNCEGLFCLQLSQILSQLYVISCTLLLCVCYPAGLESATGWSCMVSSPSLVKAAPAAEKISPTCATQDWYKAHDILLIVYIYNLSLCI